MAMRRFISGLAFLLFAATPLGAVTVQPGWPQPTDSPVVGSPALADLDGDGTLEVVVGDEGGYLYAWHADGTLLPGWPIWTTRPSATFPVIVDLDDDGSPEVLACTAGSDVWAYHADGTPVAGWPQHTVGYIFSSPAVADVDADGRLEVVAGTTNGLVYAWRPDGSLLPGWPQTITHDGVIASFWSASVLGDLDLDGDLEVVIAGGEGVYAWHHDAALVAGWPIEFYGVVPGQAAPSVADLDGDGDPEIILGSLHPDSGVLYVWHGDGTPLSGWPQITHPAVTRAATVADLDGDGNPEVLAGAGGYVPAWRADGTPLPGWSQQTNGKVTQPVLGDLDGDGTPEVVAGSSGDSVFAWYADGTPVPGWPLATAGPVDYPPGIADLDKDGRLEVVVTADAPEVYVWKCDQPSADSFAWPTVGHDSMHTSFYGITAQFIARPSVGTAPLEVAFTDSSTGNPTSWAWDFGDGATSTDRNPIHSYAAAGHYSVTLRAANAVASGTRTLGRYVLASFADVPPEQWACAEVIACVDAGIVQGYPGGAYRPEQPVTRGQMAVYLARAIATPTGDAGVPDPPAGTQSFTDIGADHWAYRYIEYCSANAIAQGYWDGSYRPDLVVDRGQMAVYIARATVFPSGDAALPDPPAEPSFPDVTPDGDWSWCYRAVEYVAALGIVQGYWDGYHPERDVTRDQMAVYVARAFGLPT